LLLDPPLTAALLSHIPAFQAALQITTPLDDNAWELLRPRLLAQHADAESRAKTDNTQTNSNQESIDNKTSDDRDKPYEPTDEDWIEAQGPLRARIIAFADECINDAWEGGDKVDKESAAKFAADVLIHVRKRFYSEVAKSADDTRASGQQPIVDPPQGPFTQKLTLENMKWIYDTKIKPLTESHRKELFQCNGEGCEMNLKMYGFEGVVQHYAAKHTSALSVGSVVVHWRAEWPEKPPFSSETRSARTAFFQRHGHGPTPGTQQPAVGYSLSHAPAPPQPYPGVPTPFGAPPYPEQYPPAHTMQYGLGPYPSNPPGYGAPQPFQPPAAPYTPFGAPAGPAGPYTAPNPGPSHGFGPPPPGPPLGQPGPPAHTGTYHQNHGAYQNNGQIGYPAPHVGLFLDPQYRVQLEDIVRSARELWSATITIRDPLESARVHVILFHLAKRFRSKFAQEPPLRMFNDALSNNKDMRPVRNVNGLMCRACHLGLGNAPYIEQQRKYFSLPQLVNHFERDHVDRMQTSGQYGTPLNWITDMVLLPDPTALWNLRGVVGSDALKHQLVAEAIPEVFEVATPVHFPPAFIPKPEPNWQQGFDHAQSSNASLDNHNRFYGQPTAQTPAPLQDHSAAPQPRDQGRYPATHEPELTGAPYSEHTFTSGKEQGAATALHSTTPRTISGDFSGNDLGRKSAQGYHSGHDITVSQERASRKKNGGKNRNGNGPQRRRSVDGEPSSGHNGPRIKPKDTTDAEAKAAEEAEKRQEEEIRAMWAADRAGKHQTPAGGHQPQRANKGKQAHNKPQTVGNQEKKPRTPLQITKARVQQEQHPPRSVVEPNLLDALEMHLDQAQPQPPPSTQYRQPSKIVYVDARETRQHDSLPDSYNGYVERQRPERRRSPPPYGHHIRDEPAVPFRRDSPPTRRAEPVYESAKATDDFRYRRPSTPLSYRQRSPPVFRQRSPPALRAEPLYDAHPPADEIRYEPTPRRDAHRGYIDVSRQRPVEAEELFELVHVRDAETGEEYYIRQRIEPRRAPPPEPPRYYAYDDERPPQQQRKDADSEYRAYKDVQYAHEGPLQEVPTLRRAAYRDEAQAQGIGYRDASFREPPPREVHYQDDLRPQRVMYAAPSNQDVARPMSKTGPGNVDDEYDPHFPAAAARPPRQGPRQMRY
jgi:hypothetical protein